MHLIAGLGNPGPKYAGHRHNVGFMAVEAIADAHGFPSFRSRFQSRTSEGRMGGERTVLLEPQTYMNESGRAVAEAARFYKLAPHEVIVIHDELDLEPGKVRVKRGGGTAGHNGLRSIDAHLGNDFWRVRVGIGHPGRPEAVTPWVLRDFAKSDGEWLEPLLDAIADAAPFLIQEDPANFMNRVAVLTRPAKPKATADSNGS